MSDKQLEILRHMLGIIDPYKATPKPYRNYYCADPGNAELHELKRIGAVELYAERDGYEWFRCTDDGVAAALASHKTIRKPKGARVYAAFLSVSDCLPDLTFRQFLTDQQFREIRMRA